MKLISCHIDAFGKFKNADFKFDQNMQVFYEKNGFGKTTLAEFIKAMLYSLPPTSKRANYKSERDLYKPFDYDGKFGGRLVFSCKKGTYIAVRQFGSTPTLDKFYLFDAKTNLTSNDFSSNLGEELFGIGKETFENSTFFGQQNLMSGINDDIRASLSTGVLSGDDVDNYDNAQNLIQKKVKEIKADAKALKIEDLNDEIERNKAKAEVLNIKLKRVEDELKENAQTQQKISNVNKKNTEKDVSAMINKSVALESIIDADKEKINEKMQRKNTLLNGVKIQKSDYDFLKSQNNVKKGHKVNSAIYIFMLLAIIGGISLICGGVFHINLLFIISAVVTLLALACMIVCILILRSCVEDLKKYTEILKKYHINSKQIRVELNNFDNIVGDIRFIDEEIVKLNSEVESKAMELGALQKQFRLDFGYDIQNYYSQNSYMSQKLSSIEKRNIELLNDKKHYNEELEALQDKLFELNDNFSFKNEKLNVYQKKLDILSRTSKFLEHSRDSISNRYIEPVSSRFNRYYKRFLNDGDEIVIDSNLGLRFGDKYSDVDYLSAGLYDLVYICKRFALIDLLFKKEKPAIILDDPFANFDDDKLEIARKLLNEMKDDYQIVLFTCQKART